MRLYSFSGKAMGIGTESRPRLRGNLLWQYNQARKEMNKMDYIFIIGPSAVGKTTLARELFRHYQGVFLEQNMVPEFMIPDFTEDPGLFEEQLCWENLLLQLRFFHDKGLRNIIAADFDDIRSRELPLVFKGCDYIILRLVSGDPEQIRRQMVHRKENEGGLFLPDYVERANQVIMKRKLLPNEVMIDVAGKKKEEVLSEAIQVIEGFHPMKEYDYVPDDERHYLSWVQSRQLY